jgi:hypothetical protein
MKPSIVALGLVAALASRALAAPAPGDATPPPMSPDDRCRSAVEKQAPELVAAKDHCEALASRVVDQLRRDARLASKHLVIDPGVNPNQPSITDTPGAQVSAGQTAAVASGQPVGSAGGSVAAVGATGQGLQLVTALAINPGTIATGDTESHTAWLSRFADLSVVVPANLQPAEGLTKGFSYIGGRLRLNVVAAIESSALEASRDRAVARYTDLAIAARDVLPKIAQILADSADPLACANELETGDAETQKKACNKEFDRTVMMPTVQKAREALSDYRSEADRRYLSVEARFDRGDLNADGAARKDTLFAAYLAGGYTFSPRSEGTALTVRARGGAVFFEDGMTSQSKVAGFGAIGAELAFSRDLRRYALSAGLELYTKQVKDNPMLALDQRNAFKLGVAVPVADGKTMSLGLTIPTDGGDPILVVSGDWSLLLGSPPPSPIH